MSVARFISRSNTGTGVLSLTSSHSNLSRARSYSHRLSTTSMQPVQRVPTTARAMAIGTYHAEIIDISIYTRSAEQPRDITTLPTSSECVPRASALLLSSSCGGFYPDFMPEVRLKIYQGMIWGEPVYCQIYFIIKDFDCG